MTSPRSSGIRCIFLWAALLLAPLLAHSGGARVPDKNVTVSAAVSLKDALDEMSQVYRAERPDVALHFNLGGSGTLQRQIEQGAPVDVFISASPDEMNRLEAKGLLFPGTRRNLVTNQVVLIVPSGSTGVASFQDLSQPRVKLIAIGEPQTVPAGKYAQEALAHLGMYDRLKPKFVLAKDVRQVLTYVETGNVDAGIVYATDARISQKVKVAATAPPDSHSPVVYPVAIIKASQNPSVAREFETFLQGPQAQRVFQKFGFLPAGN
jgi:molybdate transport system substrate-binding protein